MKMNHNNDNLKNLSVSPESPRYRLLGDKIIILPIAAAFLLLLVLSLWLYHNAALTADSQYARIIGPAAIFTGGFIIILCAFFANHYLLRRLNKKSKSLYLMDQQLLKMSRLASDTRLSQSFFRNLKDKLANIDAAAACAQDLSQNNRSKELEEVLAQIRSEASNSHKDIDKFLAATQPPGSRWVIREINIHRILDDLIGILSGELFYKSIRVRREYQENLPAIRSNFSRLHQIFQNLFLAVMADIPEKSVITLKTGNTAEGIRLVLTYPSLHFDKNVLKKILDPRWALQTKEPGPWLALCVHHVIRLNGRIDAAKTTGNVLSFTVELPYRLGRPE